MLARSSSKVCSSYTIMLCGAWLWARLAPSQTCSVIGANSCRGLCYFLLNRIPTVREGSPNPASMTTVGLPVPVTVNVQAIAAHINHLSKRRIISQSDPPSASTQQKCSSYQNKSDARKYNDLVLASEPKAAFIGRAIGAFLRQLIATEYGLRCPE